ncbi:hypothetical protein Pcinc_001415 [Petrolisthes cinctipes]|uniref:Uncharacterized protein n=1 Tax=Petrolisthes cinctipes TaxID=88211 RepID=A0AAE1GLB6_PETCI|nr:hypothetical protein Pcinc_001415 [Petrolisthes cinctipes]
MQTRRTPQTPPLLSSKCATTCLHRHSTLTPPMTLRHPILRAISHLLSTSPHLPRYDTHTLPMCPLGPSHLTTTCPLNARPHTSLYATRKPQILRATSPPGTFSTLASRRLSRTSLHHSHVFSDTKLHRQPHHLVPTLYTFTRYLLHHSHASSDTMLHKHSHQLVPMHHTSAPTMLRHSHTSNDNMFHTPLHLTLFHHTPTPDSLCHSHASSDTLLYSISHHLSPPHHMSPPASLCHSDASSDSTFHRPPHRLAPSNHTHIPGSPHHSEASSNTTLHRISHYLVLSLPSTCIHSPCHAIQMPLATPEFLHHAPNAPMPPRPTHDRISSQHTAMDMASLDTRNEDDTYQLHNQLKSRLYITPPNDE